jgi:dTDP-4-dehydrorhamnose 3,5-epimerase
MRIDPMSIAGAWTMTPRLHQDDRGTFLELFHADAFAAAVGHLLDPTQANISVSQAGTLRGIHFADVPPGQAKYVTCLHGSVLDVVVDLRVGSPTFGQHEVVPLDDVDRRAVYVGEGLGHGYLALTAGAVFGYLCSTTYAPGREHGVDPYCAELAIGWPTTAPDGTPLEHLLSPKDRAAPGLSAAREQGLLPDHARTEDHLAGLRATRPPV